MSPFRRREATTVVDDAPAVVEEEYAPPPGPPPPRRPLLWPWLLLLLVLVLGGLFALWWFTRDHDNGASTVNVPNVVRLKQQEAVSRLNDRGLIPRIRTRTSSAAAGTVVAQDPRPGANVLRDSVVRLAVSAARAQAVPNVVGKPAAAAIHSLQAEGFRVDTRNVVSRRRTGIVLAQSPAPGATVASGSTVNLNISRGLATVPDTVGQSRATAVAAVRGAGLVPKVFQVPNSQPKGTVVAQRPGSGARVADGSTVRLNVSNGAGPGAAPPPPPPPPPPANVQAPDVTGQQQDDAQRQLNAAGLKAGVVYVKSDQPQGSVVSQSPAGGQTVKRGTRVQLNVALGAHPGTLKGVPDVRNLDPATARSKLSAAGFNVQTLRQPVTDPSQVGKVVDEQPRGRNAPLHSVVTIYVGTKA